MLHYCLFMKQYVALLFVYKTIGFFSWFIIQCVACLFIKQCVVCLFIKTIVFIFVYKTMCCMFACL